MRNLDPPSASQILEIAKSHIRPIKPFVEVAKEKTKAMEESAKKAEKNKSPPAKDIPLDVKTLLMLVISVLYKPTSFYYELLSVNYRVGNNLKKAAIQMGMLVQHDFHPGTRSGKIALLEPTDRAFALFGMPPMFQNPGFLHCFLMNQVKEAMIARGYKVSIEKAIRGKSIDVVLERDKELKAIECAVSDAHEVENVRKDLRVGMDEVYIIGLDKKVIAAVTKKIRSAFSEDILSKVTVCSLAQFIDKHS